MGWAFLKISGLRGLVVGPQVISPEWDMLEILKKSCLKNNGCYGYHMMTLLRVLL